MGSNENSEHRSADRRATRGLQARYLRLLRVSRLVRAAFWTTMGFFLFWTIPWLPGGLSEDDYNRRVALTLTLSIAALGIGAGALVLREWLRRFEEALGAFNAVYDSTTGLYNRRYFLDRLTLECDRGQRLGAPFSVLLFRFEPENAGHKAAPELTLRLMADELIRQTRDSDVVAVMGGNELAVAAVGVDKKVGSVLGCRLRSAIETVLTDRQGDQPEPGVRLGVSEYPGDGTNAATLLRLARESMSVPAADRDQGTQIVREKEAA